MAALCAAAVAAAGAHAEETHPLSGTWVGKWKSGTHQEVRVDAAREDGSVEGSFCGVRPGDGSIFWFDFDDVKATFEDGEVEIERGTDVLRFSRRDEDTVRYQIERKGKTYRLDLKPPAEDAETRCLDRLLRAGEAWTSDGASGTMPAAPLGVWSYDGEGSHNIGIEVRMTAQEAYAGTVCWQRTDRSSVFYDFGPQTKIEAQADGDGLVIERKPFKARIRQRAEVIGEQSMRWSEQMQNNEWKGNYTLKRGSPETGCLARLRRTGEEQSAEAQAAQTPPGQDTATQ